MEFIVLPFVTALIVVLAGIGIWTATWAVWLVWNILPWPGFI